MGCSINLIGSGEPGFKEQQRDKLQGHGRGEINMMEQLYLMISERRLGYDGTIKYENENKHLN